MKYSVSLLLLIVLFTACSEKYSKVPDDKFVGIWQIQGRSMFEGIEVKIEKTDNNLTGRIYKLNDNKFIKMFADSNDVWVSEITRKSNFEFKLTEKKIARDLFSLYGLSTSQEFKAQFIDDNTIGLATESSDPQTSKILYKRIK
jgi:hypothetical protein